MRRGEIYWCQFKSPDKRRPVLVLTRDSSIKYLSHITVAPITTTIRGVASEVQLGIEDGMPKDCSINFHNIQTVAKGSLESLITTLSLTKMQEAEQALQYALGIDINL